MLQFSLGVILHSALGVMILMDSRKLAMTPRDEYYSTRRARA